MNRIEVERLRQILRQQLESLQSSGIVDLPRGKRHIDLARIALVPPEKVRMASSGSSAPSSESQTSATTSGTSGMPLPRTRPRSQPADKSSLPPQPALGEHKSAPYGAPLTREERVLELERLAAEVSACTRCAELARCRTQTVFGTGNPEARLVFFGEAPGAEEDIQGEPFVGAAGQLLDRIIEACTMKREDVYIMNTVKCRPPKNRNPFEQETANCWNFAERQFEIIQPEFICCLGAVAARTLLKTSLSVGKLRGKFYPYRDSQVMVTYHPAYLLRQVSAKRLVWDDMKMLMAAMEIDLSQSGR